uniref:Uncharacterized protein n=1 Tax=Anguilla anguilla TaxID=7936 RepID=A0A0E9S503_ANGAN
MKGPLSPDSHDSQMCKLVSHTKHINVNLKQFLNKNS